MVSRVGDSGDGRRAASARATRAAEEPRERMRALADARRQELARRLEGIARALRETSEQLHVHDQEAASRYSEQIGDRAEQAADYVRQRDAGDLLEDVERFARHRPWLFLGGCLLTGLALGRFLRASPTRAPRPVSEARTTEPAPLERPPTTPRPEPPPAREPDPQDQPLTYAMGGEEA